MNQILDLVLVRTFVAVTETGSFAQAADRLHLAAPTVSLQMKRLSETVGSELFLMDGRGKRLTEAGRKFLTHGKRLLQQNDAALLDLKASAIEGDVRLGASQDFNEDALPFLLREFSAAHPRLHVQLFVDTNGRIHEALDKGDIDLAIVAQNPRRPRVGQHLFSERLFWIGADDFVLKRDEAIPLVVFQAPCIVRDISLSILESAGLRWRIVCTSPSLSGVRAACRAGLGVMVRTRAQLDDGLREIRTVEGLPPLPTIDLGVYWNAQSEYHSIAVQRLITLLKDGFAGSGELRRVDSHRPAVRRTNQKGAAASRRTVRMKKR